MKERESSQRPAHDSCQCKLELFFDLHKSLREVTIGYEFHQNSDQACGRLLGRWLSAPKLAEMINNELMLQVPQALRVQDDACRM